MEIKYKKLGDLKPYENNARTHSEEQVAQICASIREFGFTNPLLIDENGGIIAGHGRLEAAKILKMDEVPTIELKGLSEAQKRAYVIADNQLALNAGWDEELLRAELDGLKDLDFDLSELGLEFQIDEIESEPIQNKRAYDDMLNTGTAVIIGDFEHLYQGEMPKINIPFAMRESAVEQVVQLLERISNECRS
nr:MAG TPA: ParB protein [Caudoviricetes sp.]